MTGPTHWAFLASAVAGRTVSVQASGKADALAYSDGQAIIVADDERDWRPVAGQAALVGAGSLDPALLRNLVGKPGATARYGYLEMLRAARVLRDRLPLALSGDAAVADPLSASVRHSLEIALGSAALPAAPRWFGQIRPLAVLSRSVGDQGFTALTRRERMGATTKKDIPEFDDDDKTEQSAILKLFQNPFSKGNPIGELLNDILGAGVSKGNREAAADGEGGAEMPVGRIERTLRRGASAMLARLPFALPDVELGAAPQALTYREWDAHAGAYRSDWVSVEEVEPWREGGHAAVAVLGEPSIALRRQLASLGLDHESHRRQSDGADLDSDALIEAAIDLRTGHSPPALNIYRASRRTRRDLAVVVVLDISGSTGDGGGVDSVFAKQMRMAFQLARALDLLGDTVAMFGFHSWGRKLVRAVRLKGAGERWTGAVAERMRMLEPVGYTRTGTAIRHGTRMLQTGIRLPHRLLILITDGIAYDQDYEHLYAEGDTRKALAEAEAAGTACVCLSIGAGKDAAKLSEVFGAANILAIDEVEEATGHIRAVCQRALSAVAGRTLRAAEADLDQASRKRVRRRSRSEASTPPASR